MSMGGLSMTMSHAAKEIKQRTGIKAGSGTTMAAMNRLNQPCRVMARSIPSMPQETASAGGIAGTRAFAHSPIATPRKTAGKIRPP